jgi:hypothetical protein
MCQGYFDHKIWGYAWMYSSQEHSCGQMKVIVIHFRLKQCRLIKITRYLLTGRQPYPAITENKPPGIYTFHRLSTNLEKDLMGGIYNVDFFVDLNVFITGILSINLLSSRHWLQF